MISDITINPNSNDVEHLQWLHGLLNYHRDMDARTVTVIGGSGWQFQFEGESAIDMTEGLVINIPANKPHKIIKGNSASILNITIEVED